jgi:hypothetical protein
MTATTADPAQGETAAPSRSGFGLAELALLVGAPLAWAVVLLFHGSPDPDDIYGSLRDEATRLTAVHLASLVFIGLLGAALFYMLRGVPGRAAQVSRLALGPFVVFYAAGDAITGVATGVLVEHASNVPAGERAGAASAAQELWDNSITSGDLLLSLGSLAWVVAAIAAAVAFRRAGAPAAGWVLLALSSIIAFHSLLGPLGLVCFAIAAVLLMRSRYAA